MGAAEFLHPVQQRDSPVFNALDAVGLVHVFQDFLAQRFGFPAVLGLDRKFLNADFIAVCRQHLVHKVKLFQIKPVAVSQCHSHTVDFPLQKLFRFFVRQRHPRRRHRVFRNQTLHIQHGAAFLALSIVPEQARRLFRRGNPLLRHRILQAFFIKAAGIETMVVPFAAEKPPDLAAVFRRPRQFPLKAGCGLVRFAANGSQNAAPVLHVVIYRCRIRPLQKFPKSRNQRLVISLFLLPQYRQLLIAFFLLFRRTVLCCPGTFGGQPRRCNVFSVLQGFRRFRTQSAVFGKFALKDNAFPRQNRIDRIAPERKLALGALCRRFDFRRFRQCLQHIPLFRVRKLFVPRYRCLDFPAQFADNRIFFFGCRLCRIAAPAGRLFRFFICFASTFQHGDVRFVFLPFR